MIPIGSNLYIGDISSLSSLSSHPRITATLSVLTPPHSSYRSLHNLPLNHNHLFIPLSDTPTANLLSILPNALPFIHAHATTSTAVLIHCLHGRSRSAAVALAYDLSAYQVDPHYPLHQLATKGNLYVTNPDGTPYYGKCWAGVSGYFDYMSE